MLHPPREPILVTNITCGIIFVVAKWSGASQIAFATLNTVLVEIANLHNLTLHVADTDDEFVEQFIINSGDVPTGGGETYWIKDGVVIAKMSNYNTEQRPILREYTERITIQSSTGRA